MTEENRKFIDAITEASNMISKSLNTAEFNLLLTSTIRLEQMKQNGLIQDYKLGNEQLFVTTHLL